MSDKIVEIRARHKNTENAWADDAAYETARDIHVDRAELIAICNASRAALANAYDRRRESRAALESKHD